jgi:hypothetical protein
MATQGKMRFIVRKTRRTVSSRLADQAGLDWKKLPQANPVFFRQIDVEELWAEQRMGGWVIAYRLFPKHGQLVVGEVRLFPTDDADISENDFQWSADALGVKAAPLVPTSGLTARALRGVKIGEALGFTKQFQAWLWKSQGTEAREAIFGSQGILGKHGLAAPGSRMGRKPLPDLELAQAAEAYATAWQSGSRRPVADAATALKQSVARTRDLVHESRRRGFLTQATVQGRPGGDLTDAARAILGKPSRKKKTGKP